MLCLINNTPPIALRTTWRVADPSAATMAQAELSALSCSVETRREVKSILVSSFKDWLQRTGNMRQLHDLMGQ